MLNLGISPAYLELMTMGMVFDLAAERSGEAVRTASQADFNKF